MTNEKQNTTIKTVLFAGLIMTLMISVTGMSNIYAEEDKQVEIKGTWDSDSTGVEPEEETTTSFDYELETTTSFGYGPENGLNTHQVAGVPFADAGTITCNSYVNTSETCSGKGIAPFGDLTTQEQPSDTYWYENMCNGGTVPCVTLHWKTTDYPDSIFDPFANDTFYWQYGTTFSCSQTWGCTASGFWNESHESPDITIRDAPKFDPITTFTQYNYKSFDGTWASYSIAQDLTLGYG